MIRLPSATAGRQTKHSIEQEFRADVLRGLSAGPKRLPCKYFYDERGSQLFDAICELDEYYLTRAELAIMRRDAGEMAQSVGDGVMLIEFGSGSSTKTRLLLDELTAPLAYVPVDISREHLLAAARRLSHRYPHVEVLPVCADFTSDFDLPISCHDGLRRVVYFPGSTIGNFERAAAVELLARMADFCSADGGVLIGIDLQKEPAVIEAAYNDARGVTAQFNLNLLARINRELDADFCLEQFEHLAFYDRQFQRVDIRLVSRCRQTVRIGSEFIPFRAGEAIHTEYSHKYTIESFTQLAREAGLSLRQFWNDERNLFAVLYLVPGLQEEARRKHFIRHPR
jgi:dimethylhistidine N-methyltransferase